MKISKQQLNQLLDHKIQKILSDGTWAYEKPFIQLFINELTKLQKKYWNKVGDDILMDHIDNAIERLHELQKAN